MSDSMKERFNNDLQKVKETGGVRASRIREIIQNAASQVVAEVKEGTGDVRSIAQNSLSDTVETINGKPAEAPVEPVLEKPPATFKDLFTAIFEAIKIRLSAQLQKEKADLQTQFVGLKSRAIEVDQKLSDRYGDRYQTVKEQLGKTKTWYDDAVVRAEVNGTTVVEDKQTEVAEKAAELGSTAAKKEQQLRQQLKQLFDNVTSR